MKYKLHIAVLLILPLLLAMVWAQSPSYPVSAYGRALVEQGGFGDISRSPYAADILKLRALNIIKGGLGDAYGPNTNISYQEAAAYIIRLLGYEDEALQKGQAILETDEETGYIADTWAIGYIEEAIDQNIITEADLKAMETLTQAQRQAIENEVLEEARKQWMTLAERDALREEKLAEAMEQNKSMKKDITRQDLALWIFRALKMEQIPSQNISYVYKYRDYSEIKADRLGAVEALLQKEILSSASEDRYGPKSGVTRGEAAAAIMKIIKEYPEFTGITTDIARITGIDRDFQMQPLASTANITYTAENFNGEEFKIIVENSRALPVIIGSQIYDNQFLREGDTIEYALRDGQILYASIGDYEFVQGTLSYYDQEGNIRIEDNNKKVTELTIGQDTIITALGKPAKVSSLIPGQGVKALYRGNLLYRLDIQESVDYYEDTEYLEGIIKYIDREERIIKLEDYDGNLRTYGLDDRVIITINDYYEDINSLKPQQDATFEIVGREVKAIKAYTMPGEEVSREYKAVMRVRDVDGSTIKVSPLDNRQDVQTFKTDSYTSITYMGSPIKLYNIKTGDLVTIKAYEMDELRAEEIQLVTKRHRVKKIYKARVLNTLPTQYRLALSDVQIYQYPDWTKLDDEKIFPVKKDAEIYKDGRKLELADLDKQKNTEAYIVTVEDFGEEAIAKITLKSVSEDSVFSGTFDTQWTDNIIKLEDGQQLAFDEGTIIIKDRRLLDTSDLTYNDEAFIIKNKLPGGSNYAVLVSMENGNGFDYRNVVRGYIHDMGEDNFSLESFANLINNQWDYYYDGEEYFYLSRDTKILDNVVEGDYISRDKFLESRFWEKDSDGDPLRRIDKDKYTIHDPMLYTGDDGPHYEKCRYKSYHMLAYAVINEDGEATAINIYKRDPYLGKEEIDFKENLITGEVVSFNSTYTQLVLDNVKEYSKFYNRWQPTTSKGVINTQKAMIIKNEQVVTLNHLEEGDKIYAITDQNNGILIFVE